MDFCDFSETFPLKFDVERMKAKLAKLQHTEWLGHYDPYLSRSWQPIPLVSVGGRVDDADAQSFSMRLQRILLPIQWKIRSACLAVPQTLWDRSVFAIDFSRRRSARIRVPGRLSKPVRS